MKKEQPQKWIVAEEDDYVHVVPDFDSRPHSDVLNPIMGKFELAGAGCSCKPKVILHDKEGNLIKPIIIHNSFRQIDVINIFMNSIK